MTRSLLLWGPPGVGKSTLARALASRLQRPFADLDALLEARAGCTAAEFFATRGEPAFRALERALLEERLAGSPEVLALGGGALVDTALRRSVLERAEVLVLSAPEEALWARLSRDAAARPLLARGREALAALLAARREAYAEAHATVPAAGTPEEVLALALEAARDLEAHPRVLVPLGERSYPVLRAPVERAAREAGSRGARVLLTDKRVERALGARLAGLGERARVTLAGRGDRDKTLGAVKRVWDAALAAGIDRDAVVLGVGGGVVTDLAGFAAATLLRGVAAVHAPTTLLAMVDASVGGKTGFDHARGKNLLGALHQPRAVVCDPTALRTLPAAHRRAGLAEVVKVAAATDGALLAGLEAEASSLRTLEPEALAPWVLPAVAAKARVVAKDEREGGARAVLNFGHTVGHALELASGYRLLHGDAVALGMRVALALGVAVGVTPADTARRVVALCDALGLPSRCELSLDAPRVAAALGVDKKRREGAWRFVLCTGPGSAELWPVSPAEVGAQLERVLEIRVSL